MPNENVIGDFKPAKKGLGKVLGHLEAAIMDIIWKKGRVSVREVYDTLRLERRLAYTTVMTIMNRLADKGFLEKEKEGVAYFYTPVYTREEFNKSVVRQVIDGLLDEYADFAYSHFIQRIQEEDESRIEQLEQIIRAKQEKGE